MSWRGVIHSSSERPRVREIGSDNLFARVPSSCAPRREYGMPGDATLKLSRECGARSANKISPERMADFDTISDEFACARGK